MFSQLDEAVVRFVNGFATLSPSFDAVAGLLLQPSLRLLPITTCLVFLWFSIEGRNRPAIIQALLGTAVALLISRLIQRLSDHRPRPLHAEHLDFVTPIGGPLANAFPEWSSFPSDTTAMAFALSTGVLICSRGLGVACLMWSAIVVSAPRLYFGLHYPSDLVGGALLGMTCAYGAKLVKPGNLPLLADRAPALFYSFGFILLFQLTTLFDDVRFVGRRVLELLLSASLGPNS